MLFDIAIPIPHHGIEKNVQPSVTKIIPNKRLIISKPSKGLNKIKIPIDIKGNPIKSQNFHPIFSTILSKKVPKIGSVIISITLEIIITKPVIPIPTAAILE